MVTHRVKIVILLGLAVSGGPIANSLIRATQCHAKTASVVRPTSMTTEQNGIKATHYLVKLFLPS
jgi:hypothetical protein